MKYVAIIHSQLHLNALYAFSKLEKLNKEDELTVLIIPEADGKLLICESDIKFPCHYYVKRRNEYAGFFRYKVRSVERILYYYRLLNCQHDGKSVICIFPNNADIFSKELYQFQKTSGADNVKIVFIEEGIGTYIRDEKRWQDRGWEGVHGIKKLLHNVKALLRMKYGTFGLTNYFVKRGKLENYNLFNKTENGIIPNRAFCKAFSEAFSDRAGKLNVEVDYTNTILVNSQRIFDEQNQDLDIECYKKLQEICNKLKIRLIIKPHPREKNLGRYEGFEVDTGNRGISQEILIAKSLNKPLALVGFFSTTLITGHLFYDIPAFCLGKLVDCGQLSGYNKDIKNFVSLFSDILIVPESYEELESVLSFSKH